MLVLPCGDSMLLAAAFREQRTMLLAWVRSATWVSLLQESCNAMNLYPGGKK